MKLNPLLAIDFYKSGHLFQYPEGTEYVYSNFTPRSNHHFNYEKKEDFIVWVGLVGFIKHFLIDSFNEGFFNRPKAEVIAEYKSIMDEALGGIPLDHIEDLHDLGYLPLEIRSLPEGSKVPIKVPVLTVINTLPKFYWLTNYIETILSAENWKMSTVATIAFHYRKIGETYAEKTGVDKAVVDFQFHDFSFRGLSGMYDAASTGMGHLTSFLGTDNVISIDYIKKYYNSKEPMFIAGSVPATEHSVMCVGGKEDERETFRRLIEDIYPTGIVSIVSDTWNFWDIMTVTAPSLKEKIMARKPDAMGFNKVVFRPDSGDPVKIITGYKVYPLEFKDIRQFDAYYKINGANQFAGYEVVKVGPVAESEFFKSKYDVLSYQKPGYILISDYVNMAGYISNRLDEREVKGAIQLLWENFGGTVNEKGFKVLDPHVGLIYGDSITLDRAETILQRLMENGFASSNVVFGVGSYTYQMITRDTFGFAMKATWAQVNGEGRNIQKDPVTDNGTKKSLTGLISVEKDNSGNLVAFDKQDTDEDSLLQTVFINGNLLSFPSLTDIRTRVQN